MIGKSYAKIAIVGLVIGLAMALCASFAKYRSEQSFIDGAENGFGIDGMYVNDGATRTSMAILAGEDMEWQICNDATTSLFESGINKIAQKVGEEAVETVIEATNGTNERLIYEGADLIYHMIVLLTSKGYRIEDLARELQERHSSTWKKH